MAKSMGSQKRPSKRGKSRSTRPSKLKGTSKRSAKGLAAKGTANNLDHESRMS